MLFWHQQILPLERHRLHRKQVVLFDFLPRMRKLLRSQELKVAASWMHSACQSFRRVVTLVIVDHRQRLALIKPRDSTNRCLKPWDENSQVELPTKSINVPLLFYKEPLVESISKSNRSKVKACLTT